MITVNFETEINEKQAQEILSEIMADPMGGWASLPNNFDAGNWRGLNRRRRKSKRIRKFWFVLGLVGHISGIGQ